MTLMPAKGISSDVRRMVPAYSLGVGGQDPGFRVPLLGPVGLFPFQGLNHFTQ